MNDYIPDEDLVLEPCDIFLTRGTGFVSNAIRRFTRSFGEKRTEANHVGIIVERGSVHSAVAVEALTKVKRHPLGRYSKKGSTCVAVFRPINLTPEEKETIVAKANDYVDRPYGWMKIVTHLLDWGLQGAYVFRRLTNDDNYPICSWVVAHAFLAVGKDFDVDAAAASPDDIWDFVTEEDDKYMQARDLVPIPEPLSSMVPV
ncbi:MAG: YiiX/YebB-like N1pC/P60 family cysteine hydrolase [Acidimicrobiia bacterium]|nr:YiiX/YebB-like N1pC/P60 family cysteine hydrolase [Acidimicrobiia bacterium]